MFRISIISLFYILLTTGPIFAQFPGAPDPKYKVTIEKSVMVSMRDGKSLSTDIYFPEGYKGKLPTIMIRTPYGKTESDLMTSVAEMFASQGYAVAFQDKRGRFESEGDYIPSIGDAVDGYDTTDWLSKQTWSNGKVGMIGCSYPGDVQLFTAQLRHPALKAIVPQAAGSVIGSLGGDYKYFGVRLGGTIELAQGLAWFYSDVEHFYKSNPEVKMHDIKDLWWHLPLNDITHYAGIPEQLTTFNELTMTPVTDPWWDQFLYMTKEYRSDVPALHVNSWYDFGSRETIITYEHMRDTSVSKLARENQFMIMSPTTHCRSESVGANTIVGERGMGDAGYGFIKIYFDWFDFWLKGEGNSNFEIPKIHYYLMGKNEWKTAEVWPIPGTIAKKYYLHSNGKANSLNGDGGLSLKAPQKEPKDDYVYDPEFPVPTKGGPVCCTGKNSPAGSFDQREIEIRNDVLVYTSDALKEGIEVTGKIDAVFYVSSSAKDTDFTAKLIDVYPDGRAFNIEEGILRARYREGQDKEVWMEQGGVYELRIDMDATSNYFGPGHKIRLEVSSSNFPRFDRNLNTGGNNYDEVDWLVANNSIHHSKIYPSHLILPVVENGK
ncbi:MAG: acylase [Gammaproteobacteria bacterium]|nr:MAG: acylase [Gammaproteobacteria bacterium]